MYVENQWVRSSLKGLSNLPKVSHPVRMKPKLKLKTFSLDFSAQNVSVHLTASYLKVWDLFSSVPFTSQCGSPPRLDLWNFSLLHLSYIFAFCNRVSSLALLIYKLRTLKCISVVWTSFLIFRLIFLITFSITAISKRPLKLKTPWNEVLVILL